MAVSEGSLGYHNKGGILQASSTEHREAAHHPTMHRAGPTTQNYPAPNASNGKAERPRATASLPLHTYHLVHGVTGVVVFGVGTPDPHGLQKLLLLLLILVRQQLLQLFFLDGGVILLFARALVVTPSVFFFLPTSSLLLPTWGATSKGGKGG